MFRKISPSKSAHSSNNPQARLSAALRASGMGAFVWDIREDLVWGDDNCNAMFGVVPLDSPPRPISQFLQAVHSEDRPRVAEAFQQAVAAGGAHRHEMEYRLLARDREQWVWTRGTVERNAQGQAISLTGVVVDISKQQQHDFERRRLHGDAETHARIFDTTLSAITDFAYIFDLNGRFLYVNKALLDLWGISLDQALGKTFIDLQYPPVLAARLQQQIQQVIDTKQGLTDETLYTSPTGAGGVYEYIFSPVFAVDGSVEVVAGSTRDVTARKRAENELRGRTAQFETLLNEAPLGVYLVDADFLIREMNPTAHAVFGDIPNLIGRDFGEVIHILWPAAYADDLVKSFRETLATGRSFTNPEHIQERLDREQTEFYEWQINRIPLPDGRNGVVCYFRDISAQVTARRRLELADRQKNEFLAMLSHELRNPLAPIRSGIELLSRSMPASAAGTAAIAVVRRQVAQLVRLVDDLFDVSRIAQGRIDLKRKPTEIAHVISHAVETVNPLFEEKRHNVSITTSNRPLLVNADSARLVQCIANILTNAAKYTDAEGEIQIRSQEDGADCVISIQDNGAGITAAQLPSVFELFVQSDHTLDRARGGLGIGLAVVKRLVEMHDGRVSVTSPGLGQGSTFEIRLPLIELIEEQEDAKPRFKSPPRRVLIVDDNVDAAYALAQLLEIDGHEVLTVCCGKEALELAPRFIPDVILLDIGLPDMDGYEVASRMRLLIPLKDTRLVALTGFTESADSGRSRAADFDDHLVKPVDSALLEKALAGNGAFA